MKFNTATVLDLAAIRVALPTNLEKAFESERVVHRDLLLCECPSNEICLFVCLKGVHRGILLHCVAMCAV